MLTGVNPRKHGIEWNRDLPLIRPVYPNFPTLFYYAKRYGYTTGMAAGKSKFDALTVAGTLDYESIPTKTSEKDTDVADVAAKVILEHKPNVMFVHLPGNDNAGHKYGWGSPQQSEAVVNADQAVREVMDAVKKAGLEQQTIVIVTADHGGAGKSHGPDDPRCRFIPWICHGPGVRKAVDLTGDADLEVRTEDTFATACWLLGIPLDIKRIDGRPVVAAFGVKESGELLRDNPGGR
jgi:arylsulfatase A-like enzyme